MYPIEAGRARISLRVPSSPVFLDPRGVQLGSTVTDKFVSTLDDHKNSQ
jgi:hypothetical protein